MHALRQRVDLGYQYYRADTVISHYSLPVYLVTIRACLTTHIAASFYLVYVLFLSTSMVIRVEEYHMSGWVTISG